MGRRDSKRGRAQSRADAEPVTSESEAVAFLFKRIYPWISCRCAFSYPPSMSVTEKEVEVGRCRNCEAGKRKNNFSDLDVGYQLSHPHEYLLFKLSIMKASQRHLCRQFKHQPAGPFNLASIAMPKHEYLTRTVTIIGL